MTRIDKKNGYSPDNPSKAYAPGQPRKASEILVNLSFDLLAQDVNNIPIEDVDTSNSDRGLYFGAIQGLEYLEFDRSQEETFSYSPGANLNLVAENLENGLIQYTINVPVSGGGITGANQFPENKFSEIDQKIFQFTVNTSYIPNGQINSAINNLDFIVDREILLLSNDTIDGGNGNDKFRGLGGDDEIYGFGGRDILRGDEGNDSIEGGNGRDTLRGGSGNDRLFGDNGNDLARGGNGNDLIFGDSGNDSLFGNDGTDRLNGGNGRDRLSGGAGSDTLTGGSGKDTVRGNLGNDVLIGIDPSSSNKGKDEIDTLIGGLGRDKFILANVSTVFYDDKKISLGTKDYARIVDFNPSEDLIQLEGSATKYFLSSNTNTNISGVGIYYQDGLNGGRLGGELIGILENVNIADVSLANTSQFGYI